MIFTIEASGDDEFLMGLFSDRSSEQKRAVSEYVECGTVEVNSPEDLLNISRRTGCSLILSIEKWINKNNEWEEQPHIEIYDSFRE